MKFRLKQNKYRSNKSTYKGIEFDSNLERNRYIFLEGLLSEGKISNLQRQVEFELIPAQYEDVTVQLKTKTKTVRKMVERSVTYRADFVYNIVDLRPDGACIIRRIEDTKGFKTEKYIIKRKLMRLQGNPITEITRATQNIY